MAISGTEASRRYRERHPERIKRWRDENREKLKAWRDADRHKSPEKYAYWRHKGQAKDRGKEWAFLKAVYRMMCHFTQVTSQIIATKCRS